MRFIFIILLQLCNDCIYYKEPQLIIIKKNNGGFCFYHKNYALLSRLNEKKCGINGKDFSPRFCKIKPIQ